LNLILKSGILAVPAAVASYGSESGKSMFCLQANVEKSNA